MTKKYKHIKTGYIAILNMGDVVATVNQPGHLWNIPFDLLVDSCDWEEIQPNLYTEEEVKNFALYAFKNFYGSSVNAAFDNWSTKK